MEIISESINNNDILAELFMVLDSLSFQKLEDAENKIHNVIEQTYNNFLIHHPIHNQKNKEFQEILYTSLENIVIAYVHDSLFNLICTQFHDDDEMIYKKCKELSALKVTADQLGALADYAIPLPAAVVELASLDLHTTTREKYTCFSTAFDLVFAELKGAIVDVLANTSDDGIPILDASDITPILTTVIIHAKPLHLISNMYYVQHFRWNKTSRKKKTDCECLLAFTTAIDKLKIITVDMLQERNSRIYCDISLEDVFKITSDVDSKFDRNGERLSYPKDPLERYIEIFTTNIETATLSHSDN